MIIFKLDGILFYHKETHYTCDYTPLVGWLKAYMLPEILNVNLPNSILNTAPNDYINAKSTIFNSNIEIERFKNYLSSSSSSSKVASVQSSPLSTASSSPVYTTNSMDVNDNGNLVPDGQNKTFLENGEIEQ